MNKTTKLLLRVKHDFENSIDSCYVHYLRSYGSMREFYSVAYKELQTLFVTFKARLEEYGFEDLLRL